jgi:hypothetical protein
MIYACDVWPKKSDPYWPTILSFRVEANTKADAESIARKLATTLEGMSIKKVAVKEERNAD